MNMATKRPKTLIAESPRFLMTGMAASNAKVDRKIELAIRRTANRRIR